MKSPGLAVGACSALALALVSGGCAHRRPDPQTAAAAAASSALGEDFRATKRDNVPLYRSGPQQMTVADSLLPKDTVARVVRRASGYSLIQTETGLSGWVASDDLVSAPASVPSASDTLLPTPVGVGTGTGVGTGVSATDAINATAVATVAPGGTPASGAAAGGDSAIVAHYHLDAPPAANPSPSPKAGAAKP